MTLTKRDRIIHQRCDLAEQQMRVLTDLALSDEARTPGLLSLVNVCHRVWFKYLTGYVNSEDF